METPSRKSDEVSQAASIPAGVAPLVTVVIPCFNYGQYVGEAIESALAQTLQPVEVIVVDGGSDDPETRRIVAGIAHPRVRVFQREERHLVGSNRNFGIAHANTEWVCCLDADDRLDPTYLEKAWFVAMCEGCDIVSSAARAFGRSSGELGVPRFPSVEDVVRENGIMTSALFRKTLWESVGGIEDFGIGPSYIYEDWHFWVKCMLIGAKVRNFDREALMFYRVHSNQSLSQQQGVVSDLAHQSEWISKHLKDFPRDRSLPHFVPNKAMESGFWNQYERGSALAGNRPCVFCCVSHFTQQGYQSFLKAECASWIELGFVVTLIITDFKHGEAPNPVADPGLQNLELFDLANSIAEDRRDCFMEYLLETRSPKVCFGWECCFHETRVGRWRLRFPSTAFLRAGDSCVWDSVALTPLTSSANPSSRGEEDLIRLELSLLPQQGTTAPLGEVWLLDLFNSSGQSYLHRALAVLLPCGWQMLEQSNTPRGFALVGTMPAPLLLNITRSCHLRFLKHPYSGIIEIKANGRSRTVDLKSEEWDEVLVELDPFLFR